MENKILSVTQLNIYVRSLLESSDFLNGIYLCGEISNFVNHYKSGHLYMSLKDETGAIKAVMFKRDAMSLNFQPQNGMKVICRGRVSLYERDGSYQFYISSMQPDGVGALAVAFEQLKQKLFAEGLFDDAHKKPIPKYPSKIALVTSETGAAVQDMINVLTRRYTVAEVVLFPVQVQGELAAPQIADALRIADTMGFDVIITGRGGGSAEDLWAFNDENLARTIYSLNTPIISAVGHEIDFTIADFVSDLRAPTPSAAAELAVPDKSELLTRISAIKTSLYSSALKTINDKRNKIELIKSKPSMSGAQFYVDRRRMETDILFNKLNTAYKNLLFEKGESFKIASTKLSALSPLNILTRGFATVKQDDTYITSANALKSGDKVTIKFHDGEVNSTVI